MSKAMFLLSDLHFNTNKECRYDYFHECYAVVDAIGQLVEKYRTLNYDEIDGISLGDLVDISKKSRLEYTKVQQLVKFLVSLFDEFFLNFGNHEITYHSDNPVYSFMKTIDHPEINTMYYHLCCESLVNDIQTPERLEFENLEIVFRGFGTRSSPITGKSSIMLIHEPLLSARGIANLHSVVSYQEAPYELEEVPVSDIYCGHIHSVTETWESGSTVIHNLGSLLRTSSTEINDFSRERQVPVLLFDDFGNYVETVFESIILHERSAVLDEEAVIRGQELREEQKERAEIRETAQLPSLTVTDPFLNSKNIIYNTDNPVTIEIFSKLEKGQMPVWEEV